MQAPWKQTRCRVHVQHRLSVLARMLLPLFFVAPCVCGVFGGGGGVCGGLFVICIVVVSIFIFLLCGFV